MPRLRVLACGHRQPIYWRHHFDFDDINKAFAVAMTIPLEHIANMPAFSPYYPMPPARYRNVCFQYVYFRADPAAVDRVLPACFQPSADGFCAAFGLSAQWTANYGKFEESGLIVKCTYKGQQGYFAPVVFLNSRSSIPRRP